MSATERIAWEGGVADGRVVLHDAAGGSVRCDDLAAVAAVLQRHPDPWGGFAQGASAIGIALHLSRGSGPWQPRLAEAGVHLSGLPISAVLTRLRACADRHSELLAPPEMAARMLLEARRMIRTWGEAVDKAAEAAAQAVPRSGTILLAWPGGPACDLGGGLLAGAVARSQRPGRPDRVLVAGPEVLAAEAVGVLVAAGVQAEAVDAAAARAAVAGSPLSAVLLRCVGDGAVTERSAGELATAALARRLPVIAVGVRERVRASGEMLPAQVRRFIVEPDGAGWESR